MVQSWIGKTVRVIEGICEGEIVIITDEGMQDLGRGDEMTVSFEIGDMAYCATLDEIEEV